MMPVEVRTQLTDALRLDLVGPGEVLGADDPRRARERADVGLRTAPTAVQPQSSAPLIGPTGATLIFQLTVSDGLASSIASVAVSVTKINQIPVANAGLPQTRSEGTLVILDGTASTAPDSDLLTYTWVQTDGPDVSLSNATTATPSFTAPPVPSHSQVTLTFQLTVDDGLGGTASADVTITVQDVDAPPDCILAQASPDTLWPPNHKLLPMTITEVTASDNDQVTLAITSVQQDEPVRGTDSGDTSPDAAVQTAGSLLLRAERLGAGNGRVYHVTFTATDGFGDQCTGAVTVCVPHNKRSTCGDGGEPYDATRP